MEAETKRGMGAAMTDKVIGETPNYFVLFDSDTGEGTIGRKGGGEVCINGASEMRHLSDHIDELYDQMQIWEDNREKRQ